MTASAPEEKSIHKLIDTVKAAVAEYDKSDDHSLHGPDSDCIRCGLLRVLTGRDPEQPRRSKLRTHCASCKGPLQFECLSSIRVWRNVNGRREFKVHCPACKTTSALDGGKAD